MFAGAICRSTMKGRLRKARVKWFSVVYRRVYTGVLHFTERKCSNAAIRPPTLPTAFFISDKQWAHDVIEASGLSKSSDGHEFVIFHVNPGSGVLIESLQNLCDHKQIAWEPRKLYRNYMKSLTEAYSTKFAYCSCSFVSDKGLKMLDEVFPNDGITDDARYHVKIVGNDPKMYYFIPKLVSLLAGSSKIRLCQFGVIEPILIVTGSEYRLMTEAEHLWRKVNFARTPVYELFLRTELLKTVPLSAFNHAKQLVLKRARFDYDQENLYIVRLSLREDLDSVCDREDILGLTLLLRVINMQKAHRAIPAMERLCPDTGLVLLELGISMMDRFYDVPLSLWPEIYRAVTSSSQFSCSALYHIFQQHGVVNSA